MHTCLHSSTEVSTVTSFSVVNRNIGCAKCSATKKSGKLSCCAQGGAWFRNCGKTGDPKYDHTWIEGIRACRDFAATVLVESPLQAMLRHAESESYLLNITRPPNTTPRENNIYPLVNMFGDETADSKSRVGIAKVVFCICVLSTILYLQTYLDVLSPVYFSFGMSTPVDIKSLLPSQSD